MEVEETIPAPEYIKGFNEGYIIAKHMPELSEPLAKAMVNSPRSDGFRDGKKQVEIEKDKVIEKDKAKDNTPKWLKTDRLKTMGKDDVKEKGKTKDERDER